jgi:nickel/cobalt exporter
MTELSQLLQQGAAHAWLFVPSAILLGALHGWSRATPGR